MREIGHEKEIINCIINTSIILMSMMMSALTQLMVNSTDALASGIAGALGGKEAEAKVGKDFKQKLPEIDGKMKKMISDIRKDVYSQLGQRIEEIKPMLSDSAFDAGPGIVENYDFRLPRMTQELDDKAIAGYVQLLVSEDPKFAEMFKRLVEWMNSLPKPKKKSPSTAASTS